MLEGLEMELSGSEPEVPATPTPETPASSTETVTPESPAPVEPSAEPVLYDLPDGRKVDAATLQKEWKENFLPDYTRKSQKIAEIERGKDNNRPDDTPPWKQEGYVPENYAEIVELAKQEAIKEIQTSNQREQERMAAIQGAVEAEIKEIKATDPKLDENALFLHANKYGFHNLKAAHQNMMDLRNAALEAEQRTLKNLKVRETDPVSSGASGGSADDDGYDPAATSIYASASEYLARLKGNK